MCAVHVRLRPTIVVGMRAASLSLRNILSTLDPDLDLLLALLVSGEISSCWALAAGMLLLLVPASTGLAARAAVGRHQQLRMMASECPRLPEPEQSEQRQTATFAMG